MHVLPEKCENINAVKAFCDCISSDDFVDAAARSFCKHAADGSGSSTGDDLVELKKALKDLE